MPAEARIGPNAILQLLAVLEGQGLRPLADEVLARAAVARPPPDAGMLPEGECAAVHPALRALRPEAAGGLLRAAGLATGDYILAHRIPRAAQIVLRVLPGRVAAPLLAGAIARHAWTFAGSGRFEIVCRRPLTFAIHANPLAPEGPAEAPQCGWHAAVFERLFGALVDPGARFRETACVACGDPACVFERVEGGK